MKILFLFILFLGISLHAEAHVPVLVSQETPENITRVEDPILSQAFYGSMNGFPHTYEIVSKEPFHLFTHILAPDIGEGKTMISGVIIKLPQRSGRVTEISALDGKDAEWNSRYEPYGGDSYLEGPQFEGDLEPGTYRIEVHTPDNQEQYVLVVGTREEMNIGYIELLKRLIEVKHFFGKSAFFIIESPFVYIPLGLLGLLFAGVWYIRKKRSVVTNSGITDVVITKE